MAKKKEETVTEEVAKEAQTTTPQFQVTDEDFNLALQALSQWHRERGIQGFALVNTSSLLAAWQGNRLAVEAALRHAYEQIHGETAVEILSARQASDAARQLRSEQ